MYQECFVAIWLIKVRSKLCRLIIKIKVSENSEEKETRFFFFLNLYFKENTDSRNVSHLYTNEF